MPPKFKFWTTLSVFQNDLVYNNTDKSNIKMCVGDHQMYFAGQKMEEVERTFTNEGREVSIF